MKKIFFLIAVFMSMIMLITVNCNALRVVNESAGSKVNDLIRTVKLKTPVTYQGMTIIPITFNSSDDLSFITLDEAFKKGIINITELKDGAEVNTLLVQNNGKENIFIMAGEILTGCKQDRILKDDILLSPNGKKIQVSAFCTEQGRWTKKSESFSYECTISPQSVRKPAQVSGSQGMVWQSVSDVNQKYDTARSNNTGALNYVYKSKKVQESITPYFNYFLNIPENDSSIKGVMVLYGNNVSCVDLFGNHRVFKKLWPRLLKSYVMDYASDRNNIYDCKINKFDIKTAKKFINNAIISKASIETNPGSGKLFKITGDDVQGKALMLKNSLVHLVLFAETNTTGQNDKKQKKNNFEFNNVQQIVR